MQKATSMASMGHPCRAAALNGVGNAQSMKCRVRPALDRAPTFAKGQAAARGEAPIRRTIAFGLSRILLTCPSFRREVTRSHKLVRFCKPEGLIPGASLAQEGKRQ
eukprot:gene12720-biopygen488